MPKMHYVYLTTNLINGKQYVGDHTINMKQSYYVGSGGILRTAFKKYNKNNFLKEILEWFKTREKASLAQKKYIKQFNTLTPNGYNISPMGGLGISGCHSEETKQKISNKAKLRTGEKNSFYGKKHTKESKEQMSKHLKGHISSLKGQKMSEESKHLMSIAGQLRIGEKNSMFGKTQSEKAKLEMSIKAKKRAKKICQYCSKEMTVSMHNRWHGENCKNKNLIYAA